MLEGARDPLASAGRAMRESAALAWLRELLGAIGRPAAALPLLLAFGFLALIAVLVGATLALTGGHLIYSLDDAYIQLSLAWNIAHGHYGMNAAEVSSPSSSILYPFLLAPFAWTPYLDEAPLILNTLAGAATLALLGWAACRQGIVIDRASAWRGGGLLIVLAIAVNLAGLVLTGLEHSLHVLVTTLVILGLAEVAEQERLPWWLPVAIVLGPLLRLEGCAISLLAIATLTYLGRRRAALDTLFVLVLLAVGYELLMARLGLPALPSSVLVKSAAAQQGLEGHDLGMMAVYTLAHLLNMLRGREGYLFLVLIVALAVRLFWPSGLMARRREAALVLVPMGALAAHLLFGEFGYFWRYEVYVLIAALVALAILWRAPLGRLLAWLEPQQARFVAVAILLLGLPYARATLTTPLAARGIYEQQVQMRRFVEDYWKAGVAVNDFGAISYHNPYYVLDLWGLGSEPARKARLQEEGTAWMGRLAREKGVGLAMVYEDAAFPALRQHPPEGWRRMAVLHMADPPITNGGDEVAFYATDPAAYDKLEADLKAFQPTLGWMGRLEILN
jgi:hypothetical protein